MNPSKAILLSAVAALFGTGAFSPVQAGPFQAASMRSCDWSGAALLADASRKLPERGQDRGGLATSPEPRRAIGFTVQALALIACLSLLAPIVLRAEHAQPHRIEQPGPLQVCAAYDLHYRTLIDDLSETAEVDDDELKVGSFLHQQALSACWRGDFAEAFEAFEAVALPPASLTLLEDLRAAAWLAADRKPKTKAEYPASSAR